MLRRATWVLSIGIAIWPALAVAQSGTGERRAMALGFNLDLFPTVISAVNGKLGYAPQVWLGVEPVRVRFVGAHLEPPDALAFADAGFRNPTTTALAMILDYTSGPHFDGFWAGAGFEIWLQSIEHDNVAGTARWTSAVFTVGGGYIWRFSGNFFLDPWLAVHATLNPQTVTLGTFEHRPFPIIADASLKVGWFYDL
ncbi:MAG TPA: hypothetical protein VF881_20190 [Polyangiaceae bacterium]